MISRQTTTRFLFNKYAPILFCWLGFLSVAVFGEKMPLKHLTTADGLPQNTINCVNQDRKGFFWVGTNGGLARFDGYEFVNFTKENGLPRNEVLDFLETRDGDFWLATKGGLVKFTPDGKIYDRTITGEEAARLAETPTFITYPLPESKSSTITKLLQDSRDSIWVGTDKGLFQLGKNGGEVEFLPININLPLDELKYIYALYEDRQGAIWVGTEHNLTRISINSRVTAYRIADGEASVFSAMLEDRAGNFWVGTQHKGLFRFSIDENETPQIVKQFADVPDSEVEWIDVLRESADGKIWIGGNNGLSEFAPVENKLFRYTRTSGLDNNLLHTIFEDQSGNLWLGTKTNGIYQLSPQGLVSFETEDRISFVRSVGLDDENNLILTAFVTNTELDEKGARVSRDIAGKAAMSFEWRFGKLGGNGFSWIIPKFSAPVPYYGWGSHQLSFQARSGEWWIVTGRGLFRFPKVEFEELKNTAPISRFDENSGLSPADVFRVFEDSKGNVWIATSGEKSNGFYKWERETGTLRDMSATEGFSAVKFNLISAFAEDRAGAIWLGFYSQGFARFRNEKIDFWGDERGVPPGGITSLFFDRENRLWVAARQGGVLRIDNPEADAPGFISYTETSGLSSNRTLSVTQDKQGFIYIGTDRDINRLNPQTEKFKQFSLAKNRLQREYRSAVCDKDGTLWFGTTEGLVKYVPKPDKAMPPPEILVMGVRVEGVPQNVSATGATELNLPTLAPQQNQVRIDYVSLSNFEDENVGYQYKFDDDEWSPPSKERFVNFANLSAGNYRIYLRAIAAGNAVSEKPAVVSFQILAPVYLRWWFFALAFTFAGAGIFALYHYRVQKLLEMERARTLIASDLHDDIGSNLSKISVLSEVARMQTNGGSVEQSRLLNSIAEISRQSIVSMSDIVWAINPQRDSALEMIRRMREYAEEIFVPKGVVVKFVEPEMGAKIKLPMDLRRDLYLIFKEAINNVAKHSGGTSVRIIFQVKNNEIILKIEDNGCGFDASRQTSGNGLSNMQNRVAKLKGKFQCESKTGGGTIVEVHVPQN